MPSQRNFKFTNFDVNWKNALSDFGEIFRQALLRCVLSNCYLRKLEKKLYTKIDKK